MVNYRRNFLPGGIFFFTVTIRNRNSTLLVNKINLLQKAVQKVKLQLPFQIKAYVILPEHLHMIWQLPVDDSNYSLRWQKIKALFSKSVNRSTIKLSRTKHNELLLWQRRFWEHTIQDNLDFENHFNYIHYNPMKHGLVQSLSDWPYSSFHYYVQSGLLSKHWERGDLMIMDQSVYGE